VDFDGTLMNSAADLVEITKSVLSRWLIDVPVPAIEALLGLPTAERFRHHGLPEHELDEAVRLFAHLHAECRYRLSVPLAGAETWLAATPGLTKWAVSASPWTAVSAGLAKHGLDGFFERVVAAPPGGGFDKGAALAPERARFAPGMCWFVGDQEGDIAAGRSVGARVALMLTARNAHLASRADRILTSFESLLEDPLELAWTPSR